MTFSLDGITLHVERYSINTKAKVSTRRVPYKSGYYYTMLGIYNEEIELSIVCSDDTLNNLRDKIKECTTHTFIDPFKTRTVKLKSFDIERTSLPNYYVVKLVLKQVSTAT